MFGNEPLRRLRPGKRGRGLHEHIVGEGVPHPISNLRPAGGKKRAKGQLNEGQLNFTQLILREGPFSD